MDEGCVTSLAFGNKRRRILFAHTEENSSSPPHAPLLPHSLWSLPAPWHWQPGLDLPQASGSSTWGAGGLGLLPGMKDTEEAEEGQ